MPESIAMPSSPWHAADAAYLAHHFRCPHCIAAGATQGERARCVVGQALWTAYVEAGLPLFQHPKGATVLV